MEMSNQNLLELRYDSFNVANYSLFLCPKVSFFQYKLMFPFLNKMDYIHKNVPYIFGVIVCCSALWSFLCS